LNPANLDYNFVESALNASHRQYSIYNKNIELQRDQPNDVQYGSEVVTWVDLNGIEEMAGPTSWYNDVEAKACVRICRELKRVAPLKSISIVTRYTEQRRIISNYLQNANIGVRVLTTTGALGTQADMVLFSIVRNNPERLVGAVGSLQDLNVAVSHSKEKLIIVGSFDMMLNGRSRLYGRNKHVDRNLSCKLANLVDKKYGYVVEAPLILTR
jgi:superfamily I DNA and/or RNA helicase